MSEAISRILNHFSLFAFKDSYWTLDSMARAALHQQWLRDLRESAQTVHIYQVFPAESQSDVLAWCALNVDDTDATKKFFECYARATNPIRTHMQVTTTLWGYTRPSQYSKAARSAQEIDPFNETRKPYLVMYPFVKTTEWYLMGRESRQGMMNEHIRIGKQYEDISQLLLYSTGIQDQEFVVVYETDDLPRFSELVSELRSTDGRAYTLRDTPLHTAIYHPPAETLALFA